MSVKLLTEHHLEFLNIKGGCTGLSESTPVKMPHCLNHMSRLILRSAEFSSLESQPQNHELKNNPVNVHP